MTASFEIGQTDVIASDFHTNGLCKLYHWNLWSPSNMASYMASQI